MLAVARAGAKGQMMRRERGGGRSSKRKRLEKEINKATKKKIQTKREL